MYDANGTYIPAGCMGTTFALVLAVGLFILKAVLA
jgi:hypothetical protein